MTLSNTPPINFKWIMSRRDLPQDMASAKFLLTDIMDRTRKITVKGRMRQVLQSFERNPLYCASPVRLSHNVMCLKDDSQVSIRTDWFFDKQGAIATRYGVYVLQDKVTFLGEVQNAYL